MSGHADGQKMSTEPNKGDIVERLIGVTDKYPGFRNLNTEAAATITTLRSQVADLTAQRDAMVRAGETISRSCGEETDELYWVGQSALIQLRTALALCQPSPGSPQD